MTDNAIFHPLTQRIASLRLPGMLAAFQEQLARHDLDDMPFEDRLALLVDRGFVERRSRALQRRLKKARLRHQVACFEDINLTRPRGLSCRFSCLSNSLPAASGILPAPALHMPLKYRPRRLTACPEGLLLVIVADNIHGPADGGTASGYNRNTIISTLSGY